jgi:hypothetical protein
MPDQYLLEYSDVQVEYIRPASQSTLQLPSYFAHSFDSDPEGFQPYFTTARSELQGPNGRQELMGDFSTPSTLSPCMRPLADRQVPFEMSLQPPLEHQKLEYWATLAYSG